MTILNDIDEYMTDCVKAGIPFKNYAIDEDQIGKLHDDAIIRDDTGESWNEHYLPVYSLTREERRIPGIVGKYRDIIIVSKG